MQPDTINAIGMIMMAVFTAGVVLFFRTKPLKNVSWKTRVPLAIGGCIFALFVFAMFTKRCIEIPEPFGQFELTALSLLLIIIFVEKEVIVISCCVIILWTGLGLNKHFDQIVRYADEYTTIDANTHKPMVKGCGDMKSSDGIVPENLWHTWFTGIYRINK